MAILQRFNNLRSKLLQNVDVAKKMSRKSLWGYVAIAFNRVDIDRLQKVGPDRLCAEWILKNGGGIRTVESPHHLQKDYNSLPSESVKFNIKVVDASDSSIMKIGFDHFKGCRFIDTLILHKCKHLEADGLDGIVHLKNSLKVLQVSACDNISDLGLMIIGELSNLELLKLHEMYFVNDMDAVAEKLKRMLPNCHMDID